MTLALYPDTKPRPSSPLYKMNLCFGTSRAYLCCMRQVRDINTSCHILHGYSLTFTLTIATRELDERQWIMESVSIREEIDRWLFEHFDHKTLIAEDDPNLTVFEDLHQQEIISLVVLKDSSSEAIPPFVFSHIGPWLKEKTNGRCFLTEVSAHFSGSMTTSFQSEI